MVNVNAYARDLLFDMKRVTCSESYITPQGFEFQLCGSLIYVLIHGLKCLPILIYICNIVTGFEVSDMILTM